MNKQLILNNKEAFDHWLDGGKVLCKYAGIYPDSNGWRRFVDIWTTSDKYLVIIDDEYVEFRKAVAEGKTIQSQVQYSTNGCSYPSPCEELKESRWETDTSSTFRGEVRLYRIKPEEPQFKVGDWVRDKQTGAIHLHKEHCRVTKDVQDKYWELWKPQPDEWCWFLGDDYSDVPVFAKLIKIESIFNRPITYMIQNPNSCKTTYGWTPTVSMDSCEPFIGELPEYLQESKG
jgi:hypothetical protein